MAIKRNGSQFHASKKDFKSQGRSERAQNRSLECSVEGLEGIYTFILSKLATSLRHNCISFSPLSLGSNFLPHRLQKELEEVLGPTTLQT